LRTAKKLLLLSQFSPPETHSAANRVNAMVRKIAEHYEVRVVTLKPSYPSPSYHKGFSLEHHDRALPFEVTRTFRFHPHKGGLLVRALREHVMALGLAGRAILMPADIVIATSPTMFLGPVALLLAKIKRARFVWDVRDITWNYAREVAGDSTIMAFGLRMLERYMLFVLRRAGVVVGATPGVTKLLVKSGVAPERAITVSNGVSQDILNVPQQFGMERAPNQRPSVVYAGLFGRNHGLEVLLDVARALQEVDFVLVGDGPELTLVKEKAHKLGTANVSFEGYLNKEDLLTVYAESDVLFAKVRSTPTLDATAISFKLFEYMGVGRPIVYAGKGVGVEFLDKIGCAVTVPPEDPQAIAGAIEKLLQDPDMMRTLGERGRTFVRQHYRSDKLMESLASELKARFG
jgi:colanic acid biosynthesis glycosyl transferase WcaI